MINEVRLIGRLGADPDVRYTQQGTCVASLRMATSEWYKDKQDGELKEITEWHRVVVWDKVAEKVAEKWTKGDLVYIEGKLKTRKWTDNNNVDRYITEVQARTTRMLKSASGGGGTSSGGKGGKNSNENYGGFGTPVDEDDIPF